MKQKFYRSSYLFVSITLMSTGILLAKNPIVPFGGLTDPHAVVYGDRVYLYATHDFSSTNKHFLMKDWWCWSSADLVHWRKECVLKPQDTYLKRPFNDCWATFGASCNGKYYWYFSAGRTDIGVVEADSPAGPWRDPLGKPLIPKGLVPTQERDPDILMDDDGQAYIVFGTFDYYLARLNDDMISLAEKPKPIALDRRFGPYGEGKTDDKPSLHKRNGIYYLSWSSFYAMSTNVYGPYAFKGSVITTNGVDSEFRKGNIYHDRHGNFFTWHNQWYYACNDKSQPGRGEHFRDACISYVHYRANGEMAPIQLDLIGVGEHDAQRGRIEAENYFAATNVTQVEIPGGFGVTPTKPGGFLLYPNVHGLTNCMQMTLEFSSIAAPSRIEIREQGPEGALLAECEVHELSETNAAVTVKFSHAPATENLCVKFAGAPSAVLDAFTLNP